MAKDRQNNPKTGNTKSPKGPKAKLKGEKKGKKNQQAASQQEPPTGPRSKRKGREREEKKDEHKRASAMPWLATQA